MLTFRYSGNGTLKSIVLLIDICGVRSDGKLLNCPYGSPRMKVCNSLSCRLPSLLAEFLKSLMRAQLLSKSDSIYQFTSVSKIISSWKVAVILYSFSSNVLGIIWNETYECVHLLVDTGHEKDRVAEQLLRNNSSIVTLLHSTESNRYLHEAPRSGRCYSGYLFYRSCMYFYMIDGNWGVMWRPERVRSRVVGKGCLKQRGCQCGAAIMYFKMDPANYDNYGGVDHVSYCFQHFTSADTCMSAFRAPVDPSTVLGGFSGSNYSEVGFGPPKDF
ncbi:hypothetical protein CRG98_041578 [Punica granatum]|uniref:Uncharacterized protein n=1 Tax=Punica granatum TaxID=22663 RepID=A0A2I0I256_PUNGR|nr:hypothetical protein CRG98_041578 [Punica granatum]